MKRPAAIHPLLAAAPGLCVALSTSHLGPELLIWSACLWSFLPPSTSSILMVVVHLSSAKSHHGILPWLDFCIFFKKPSFSAGHFQPSTIFSWPGFLHRCHLVYLDSGRAIVTTVSECIVLSCTFRAQLKLASQPSCHPPRRCSEWFSPPSP